MKSKLYILLIFCIAFGCNGQTYEMPKEDKEIISKLVDELAYPTPPPPSMDLNDTIISETSIDSLFKTKLRIGIYPVMFNGIDSLGLSQLPDAYKNLVNTYPPEYSMITDTRGIESHKGHHIELVDKTKIKDGTGYKEIDMLYRFSKIWYGNDKNTAVVEVGISRSRLDGSSTILCLDKLNGEWSIQRAIPTTVW